MLAGIPSTLAGCSGRRDHAGRAQRQDRSRKQPPPVHALADEQGGDDGRTGPSAGAVACRLALTSTRPNRTVRSSAASQRFYRLRRLRPRWTLASIPTERSSMNKKRGLLIVAALTNDLFL